MSPNQFSSWRTTCLWLGMAGIGMACAPVHAVDLQILTQQALAQSPTLRAAQANVNATQETQPQARASARLPTVNFSADAHAAYQQADSAGDDSFTNYGYSINVVQPLYHPDREARLRQTETQIAQAEANYQVVAQDLILQVAERYFAVLGAQDDFSLAEAERTALIQQLKQAQQRFKFGMSPITDVNEAQASHDLAQATVIAAENSIAQTLEALQETVGSFQPPLAKLKTPLDLQPPTETLEQRIAQGLQQNPAILAAQYAVSTAKAEVSVQQAGKAASVDAIASHGYDFSSSDRGDKTFNQSIGVQLSIPLYQGGVTESRTRQARFQLDSAQENLEQSRRSVLRGVSDSYRSIITSSNRVRALEQAVRSGESALDATRVGFEAGTRTLVDVLNVQRDVFRAKRDLARERYNYLLSLLRLERAGGGLELADTAQLNVWLQP